MFFVVLLLSFSCLCSPAAVFLTYFRHVQGGGQKPVYKQIKFIDDKSLLFRGKLQDIKKLGNFACVNFRRK